MVALKYTLLIIGSYLIGNISFARLLSKLKKSDITKKGSGNPGTMNMIRNEGLAFGVLTLILDMLKGAIPALVGFYLFGGGESVPYSSFALYIAGLCAILGHNYPVFYKFKGGKGVATLLGVFAVANPIMFVICFFIDLFILYFFDYGSIFSFLIVTVMTVIESQRIAYNGYLPLSVLLFLIFSVIWFAHRSNINKLITGKENKVNFKNSIVSYYKKLKKKHDDRKNREIG